MRTKTLAKAAVFTASALVAAGALSVAATNTNTRLDLTLSRQHQLNERTRARLRALETPVELVVAVDRSSIDPRDADRVDDVLAALDAASDFFTVTQINVTGEDGDKQFEALIERLEARDTAGAQQRTEVADRARKDAGTLQWDLTSLDAAATAAAQSAESSPQAAARLGEFAAYARVAKRQLDETLAANTPEQRPDPTALVRAVASLGGTLAPQFQTIQEELGTMPVPPRARARVTEATRLAATIRERAEQLAQIAPPPTDLDRVAEALATGEAALLIGPVRTDGSPGLVSLDLDGFYPPAATAALARTGEADARVRTEQLVAQGLTILTDDARPIVVFTHAEAQRWIGKADVLTGLIDRLAKAGIDFAEWPVLLDENPPELLDLNPHGVRPVVFVVISPDSSAPTNPRAAEAGPGTKRTIALADALRERIDAGDPVLLGLNPSVFPTFSDDDPLAALLAPLGVRARTDAPVLSTANAALGPATAWDMRIVPNLRTASRDAANPVAQAVDGLPFALEWPIPLERTDEADAGTTISPLLTLDIPGAWSEREWLAYWRTPRNQRALLRDPPTFTEPDTDTEEGTAQADRRGPFTVAVAIERAPAGSLARPSRVVAVGTNLWFFDRVWQSQQTLAGRDVLTNPGNPEFFDASVLWLAGRDELIAPSPQARPVARIKPISEKGLLALRWALIGGLPLAILAVGGLWRTARG